MGTVGLERHRLALLAAKEDVLGSRASTDWALFAYEKHNDLKLLDSGAGGPDELATKFSSSSVMYGLCRVLDPGSGQPRIILISWVGERVAEPHRQSCATHLPAIRAFFKEASLVLSARRTEEVTEEGLRRVLSRLAPAAGTGARRTPARDAEELVGTNYRKTNPALEIRRTKRDSFWAQAEREEEQRKEEERRRAAEEQRRWERERMEGERREAAERERRVREKEQLIEEQRKEQARREAEERRQEKARWEQQQREHEEAARDRFRRSESIEKAAEAAVLVSQRSQNPRDFFRQRERSSSASGTPAPLGAHPAAPRRPFLRYQRSLTESAYIFRRPDAPPSPPGAAVPEPGAFRAAAPLSPSPPGIRATRVEPPPPASPPETRPLPPAAPVRSPPPPATPPGTSPLPPSSPTRVEPPPISTPETRPLPPAGPTGLSPPPPVSPVPPTSPPETSPPPPSSPPGTRPPPLASPPPSPSPHGTISVPPSSPHETISVPPSSPPETRSSPPASPPRTSPLPPSSPPRMEPPATSPLGTSPPPPSSPPAISPPRTSSPPPPSPPVPSPRGTISLPPSSPSLPPAGSPPPPSPPPILASLPPSSPDEPESSLCPPMPMGRGDAPSPGLHSDPSAPFLAEEDPVLGCPAPSSPGPDTSEDRTADGEVAPEPAPELPLAPGHNGISGQEDGSWPALEEGDPSLSSKLQQQVAWDPEAAGAAPWRLLEGGDRRVALEGTDDAMGSPPRTA